MNKLFLFFTAICLSSCSASLEPKDYISWLNNPENGLISNIISGDFIFSIQYKPKEYLAIQDNYGYDFSRNFSEKVKEYEGLEYYTLKIGSADSSTDMLKNGITDNSEYFTRIQYFSSYIQEDLKLISGKDTMPCVISHFERTYKMAPFNSIVLAFQSPPDDKEAQNDRVIQYDDQVLGVGKVYLTISKKSINKIPTLKL